MDCTVAVTAKVVVIEVDANADIGVRLSAITPTKAAGSADLTTFDSFIWIAPVKTYVWRFRLTAVRLEVKQVQFLAEPSNSPTEL